MVKMNETERKIEMFKEITEDMVETFSKMNRDYGNSFGKTHKEYGMKAYLVRVTDKLNRLKSLSERSEGPLVEDEGVENMLLDIATYSVMELIELKIDSWISTVSIESLVGEVDESIFMPPERTDKSTEDLIDEVVSMFSNEDKPDDKYLEDDNDG